MIGMDTCYATVRMFDRETFDQIVAFASTFGTPGIDYTEIDVKTRYQVERFCMNLVTQRVKEE